MSILQRTPPVSGKEFAMKESSVWALIDDE
jgi:hypothetical protein